MSRSLQIQEYINNKNYLIYKKKLSYKDSPVRTRYLIIKGDEIIDMLMECEIQFPISEERLSTENIDLIVYKAVVCENGKYYSFRMRGKTEYKIGVPIEANNSVGMFFCKNKVLTEDHYPQYENRAVFKAKVKIDDIIGGDTRDFTFRRCVLLEIV